MAGDDVAYQGQGGVGARLRRVGRSICNTEKGEFLSRTPGSWAKITVFYIIFYSCLAGFFAALMVGFFTTLDPKAPTQRRMYSLLKGNPGMGFRPMPIVESTLIKFTATKPETYSPYVRDLNKYLEFYYNQTVSENVVDCSKSGVNTTDDLTCMVEPIERFGPCSNESDFGYSRGQPCVLLKINKIFDWEPEASPGRTDQKVDVTCEGENDADKDMLSKVAFYPQDGFSFHWFPYKNQDNYRGPILFAQFEKIKKGALLQVWCKIWANNIKHHKNDRAGSVHFELLVD